MYILEPRSLLLAWGAVVASALAPQLATAQRMARPTLPATGMMSRPFINPNAAFMGSFNSFRSPFSGMMANPGMSSMSSYGAGSMGYSSGMGGYGGAMSAPSNG